MDYEALEHLLLDRSAEPTVLLLALLRAITNDFADALKIGSGGYGAVYKGVLRKGTVAVKKLYGLVDVDDQRFHNEVRCLMRLKHKNIVRFLGYCADTQGEMLQHDGQLVMADRRQRLLCFEYLRGGDLGEYVTDASAGLDWRKRYRIIKGICEGLNCLHQNRVVHLDLKPSKILLDGKMVPKICGFGNSRSFSENENRAITENIVGTVSYMAPECLDSGEITFKADIYSLGILITEILTGKRVHSGVEKILESWSGRLGVSVEDTWLQQVRVCAEIGISCLDPDPEKRPDARHIIEILVETESTEEFTETDETESMDEPSERDEQTMELNILELIVAGIEEPSHLDFPLLHIVTEEFSEHRKIGVGGCGEVYKGSLRNGVVAVKRLLKGRTITDKMFHREVKSLIKCRHQNIVRFLGYCSVTEERAVPFGGGTIMVDIRERLLCFEYVNNGTLENHLTDELRGLEWHTRYEIIVGICKGLLYLHKEKDIVHMDLKPANVLLDDHMVPKITDFGLSRLDNNSQTRTSSRLISIGYCAPEYLLEGKSSSKSDIYSLGAMIKELVTGSKTEPDHTKVLRRWRHRWIKSSKHTPLGYQQVTKCLELAQRCIQIDPTSRPDIIDITHELNAVDSKDDQFQVIPSLEDMVGIEPLEMHVPFDLDQQIVAHSIVLTNDTDDYIAFMTKARLRLFRIEPGKGIVPPRSKCDVTIAIQSQVNVLPNNHYKEAITVLSTRVDRGLAATDITGAMFSDKEGKVVDEVNVMVVFETPPLAEES